MELYCSSPKCKEFKNELRQYEEYGLVKCKDCKGILKEKNKEELEMEIKVIKNRIKKDKNVRNNKELTRDLNKAIEIRKENIKYLENKSYK